MSDIGAAADLVNGVDAPLLDSGASLDSELHAIYERNHVTNGADRGEGGQFTSPNQETPTDGDAPPSGATSPPADGEGTGAEGAETTLAAQSVPLPANMRGLEGEWAKIPADAAAKIAPHLDQLHQTLSVQGQQVAAYKPIKEFIDSNADIFGRSKQDGSKVTPHEIFGTLISHQRLIEKDLVAGVVGIAQSYGVTPQQLVNEIARRSVNGNTQPDVARELADLKRTVTQQLDPKAIDSRISTKLEETRALTALESEVNRWSDNKDKPFAKTLLSDEATFVPFITMARAKLGEAAQLSAVLDRAYDMAVNADPDLRAKAAAAKAAAPAEDPKKVAEAKRATAVNVTSTSSGSARDPSLDDKLGAVWDKHHKGN